MEALIDMFVVACFTRGLRAEDGGMELFIRGESGLGMFQVLFRDPWVFFGRISLPSDQEGTGGQGSAVAYDLLDFIFLFSIDKVRGRRREVPAVDLIFAIR